MAILAYRQEMFIVEAVRAALAQTYTPLEIILSDDCSPDNTYALMENEVKAYSGPNTIILNRNARNLGIGSHVNRIFELSHGDWVVMAAGDDVSYPNRVESLSKLMNKGLHLKKYLIFSGYNKVNTSGKFIEFVPKHPPSDYDDPIIACRHMFRGMFGCSAAWHRRLFNVFGNLNDDVWTEDVVLLFRAALLGGGLHTPDALLDYRVHDNNVSKVLQNARFEDFQKTLTSRISVYKNCWDDLLKAERGALISPSVISKCKREILRRLNIFKASLFLINGNLPSVVKALFIIGLNRGHPIHALDILNQRFLSFFH